MTRFLADTRRRSCARPETGAAVSHAPWSPQPARAHAADSRRFGAGKGFCCLRCDLASGISQQTFRPTVLCAISYAGGGGAWGSPRTKAVKHANGADGPVLDLHELVGSGLELHPSRRGRHHRCAKCLRGVWDEMFVCRERSGVVGNGRGRGHLALACAARRIGSERVRLCAPGGACEGKMPSPPGPVAIARARLCLDKTCPRREGILPSLACVSAPAPIGKRLSALWEGRMPSLRRAAEADYWARRACSSRAIVA